MPHERVEAMPLQRTVPFRALQVRRDDENGERRRDEENVKRMKRMKRTYLASVCRVQCRHESVLPRRHLRVRVPCVVMGGNDARDANTRIGFFFVFFFVFVSSSFRDSTHITTGTIGMASASARATRTRKSGGAQSARV